jgi:hypothetical protein
VKVVEVIGAAFHDVIVLIAQGGCGARSARERGGWCPIRAQLLRAE